MNKFIELSNEVGDNGWFGTILGWILQIFLIIGSGVLFRIGWIIADKVIK